MYHACEAHSTLTKRLKFHTYSSPFCKPNAISVAGYTVSESVRGSFFSTFGRTCFKSLIASLAFCLSI